MVPWQSQRLRGRRLSQHAHSPRPHRSTHSSRHGLHDPLGPRTNTLHALFPPPLTGWAAIEKALDDFDNQEMEGVKNDIDTLLVFVRFYPFNLYLYPDMCPDWSLLCHPISIRSSVVRTTPGRYTRSNIERAQANIISEHQLYYPRRRDLQHCPRPGFNPHIRTDRRRHLR